MSAVDVARAVARPEQVSRAVVPVAGERVRAGERLLVAQEERFVARVEVDLVQVLLGRQIDPARSHEAQGPLDFRGDDLVAAPLSAGGYELLVPDMHLVQVGETAL